MLSIVYLLLTEKSDSIIDYKTRILKMWFYYWLQNANSIIDWKTRIQLYLQNLYYWLQNTIKRDSQACAKNRYSIVSAKRDALRDASSICKTRVTCVTLMGDPYLLWAGSFIILGHPFVLYPPDVMEDCRPLLRPCWRSTVLHHDTVV
jgi:hypothetical protein